MYFPLNLELQSLIHYSIYILKPFPGTGERIICRNNLLTFLIKVKVSFCSKYDLRNNNVYTAIKQSYCNFIGNSSPFFAAFSPLTITKSIFLLFVEANIL